MRRRISAQEKRCLAGSGGVAQCLAVYFALGDGQAIEVRADAAAKDIRAVDHQVVRGDRRTDLARFRCPAGAHEIDRVLGGDMLEHHLQFGKIGQQGFQHLVDIKRLAIEDVGRGVGHLAVHQKRHAARLHALENRIDVLDVGDPRVGIGRRTGGIELHRLENTALVAACDLVRIGRVGQVAGHQRRELDAIRHGRHDPLTIGLGSGNGGHRRHQVGHDDGAAELARRRRHHGLQHGTVAEMHVPIVGAAER